MRLWSLHPSHLDARGIVALWREGLLARAVLSGQTQGYKNHPQLNRFSECKHSVAVLDSSLKYVLLEATSRSYHFDSTKISPPNKDVVLTVTTGQLEYEWGHLLKKLKQRDLERWKVECRKSLSAHPIFQIAKGEIANWEKVTVQRTKPL